MKSTFTGTFTPDLTKDLLMNPGDVVSVDMHDTPEGFSVVIKDLTTGAQGSMVASAANGFGQVQFAPTGTDCVRPPLQLSSHVATSSERTRVVWAAHSYNVAFSDEIGHFEYCNAVDANGNCTSPGVNDPDGLDTDDLACFAGSDSTLIPITGCLYTEFDFDGVSYGLNWPGTFKDPFKDYLYHAKPIRFTSPKFNGYENYERVAFETDLPGIESPDFSPNNNCNNTTGVGCVNPPVGASFYPIYSTAGKEDLCYWQLGGAYIPGTTNDFGGTSTVEYGKELNLLYPGQNSAGQPASGYSIQDFHRGLPFNPCPAPPFNAGGQWSK